MKVGKFFGRKLGWILNDLKCQKKLHDFTRLNYNDSTGIRTMLTPGLLEKTHFLVFKNVHH